ncbi:MAG: type II secretion system protein [Clostridia bacterium]|nr:type II secretion system protein [Clostridia bacterium]
MNKMNKKGFTIVELVIVIAVIAILAGVLIPTFGGIIDRANESAEMQKVAAAYKEAFANALADDGKVDATDFTNGSVTVNNVTFSWEALANDVEGKWSIAETDDYKYTYDTTTNAWTVEAK